MTTTWQGWFGLGGQITGAPAVVNPTPDTIDVYPRGTDGRLVQKWWDGAKWGPSDTDWLPHEDGGFSPRKLARRRCAGIEFPPAVVQASPTFHDVYVRGTNNRLSQKWWYGTRWNPSELDWIMHHDGNVRIDSAPSVVSSNGDRHVYVRGTNGTVLHKFWNNQKHSHAQAIRENANNSAWIDAAAKIETGPGKPGMAVAVIKDGRIVHLARYGTGNLATGAAVTSETMFQTGSCGKLLTALGIMMLKEARRPWHPTFSYRRSRTRTRRQKPPSERSSITGSDGSSARGPARSTRSTTGCGTATAPGSDAVSTGG